MKTLIKYIPIVGIIFSIFAIVSCSSDGKKENGEMSKLDSLQKVADTKTRQYEDLSMVMTTLSQSLDSIAYAEDMLIQVSSPESGPTSREAIKAKVAQFAQLIQRQKERIAALSDSLATKENSNSIDQAQISKLNTLITYLNQQLDSKDKELRSLQAQLSSSKASVAQLTQNVKSLKSNVSSLRSNVASLEKKNETLDKALTTQDEVINEGYIKVGTKKELEASGLLTKGGLFKKRKVNYSGFSNGGFQQIDIRHATSIPIIGKKAKLLTPAPSGSYSLSESSKGHWTLTISNPSSFWSISMYCIIQTD